MRNTILLICLSLFFSIHLSGCSLFSSSDDEAETATVSEEKAAGDEFASDEFEDGDDTDDAFDAEEMARDDGGAGEQGDLAASDVEVEDSFGDDDMDDYPDDDYASSGGSSVGTETAVLKEDFIDDNSFGSEDSLSVDEGGGIPDTAMNSNEEEDLFGSDSGPVVDTPSYADSNYSSNDSFSSDSFMDPVTDVPAFIPVKKMKPAAYKRSGSNINRLYIVRQGDSMSAIASKIYGSDRSDDLYKWNSHFQGKAINVGDKIYYESPNNPNDQSMMTYYEDNNIAPQYYSSQGGDNIRKIAKNLLGHNRSWMEIYATNDGLESKGQLPSGLQLRYWPEDGSMAPVVAQNEESVEEVAMPDPEPIEEPEEIAMNEPEEIPADDMGDDLGEDSVDVAQMDDPKPFEDGNDGEDFTPPPAVGSVAPPPPPQPVAPPPPPPRPVAKLDNKAPGGAMMGGSPLDEINNDPMIIAALSGLFILAMIIVLIFIRRSRSKRVNFSQTQV